MVKRNKPVIKVHVKKQAFKNAPNKVVIHTEKASGFPSLLSEVPEEHYFVLVNGRQLKNLLELIDALEEMEDWEFNHHVNADRNDFSNWVKEVIREEDLAGELSKSWNRHDAQRRLLKYLVKKWHGGG